MHCSSPIGFLSFEAAPVAFVFNALADVGLRGATTKVGGVHAHRHVAVVLAQHLGREPTVRLESNQGLAVCPGCALFAFAGA